MDFESSERKEPRSGLHVVNLDQVFLEGAHLKIANDGADLSGASLKNSSVSTEQLTQAKQMEGTFLPDGTEFVNQS